jgi:pimeloyl-ACP methyl ester carboxylesterase
MYADPDGCPPEVAREYQRSLKVAGTIQGLLATVSKYGQDMERLREVLPNLSEIPIDLIWGENDPVVPMASAARLMKVLPQARMHRITGVGHLPYEEKTEEFVRALKRILESSH